MFEFITALRNYVWMDELMNSIFDDEENHIQLNTDKLLIKVFAKIIMQCILFIITFIIFWIKTEKISKIIMKDNDMENINLTLSYDNILSVWINFLCIYIFLDSLPRFIFNISDFFLIESKPINYIIGRSIDMLAYEVMIILSIIGIKHNKKLIKN
jgi:hypothetical protein